MAGVGVPQPRAQPIGDRLGGFDCFVADIDNAQQHVLAAQRGDDRDVDAARRGFDRDWSIVEFASKGSVAS